MEKSNIINIASKLIDIPKGFELVHYKLVNHDDTPVYWLRFIKEGEKDRLGIEHFSITIDLESEKLMGIMWLDKNLDSDSYITEDGAKDVAIKFLKKNAPDLYESIEIRWIRPTRKKPENPPHDEGFALKDKTIITGMRVKMWANDTQKYSWVIVSEQGKVISFERDIVWNSEMHCRTTECFLHDKWLEEQSKDITNGFGASKN